jgi:malate dehydrogenase (oxaloacetate-decarboxylating)(NADP+)
MGLREDALDYHQNGRPGKLAVVPTKPLLTQRDLTLAYSPGVAEPCRDIAKDPERVFDLTTRGNLVAVVTNGTAVLGLGNIGPLAAKPVMEGKANLFKKFADIDCFDIELDAPTPDEVIAAVKAMAPTFGGVNLEDIRAPDCFRIERELQAALDIPVFHDDQHGTAMIASAALINAALVTNRRLEDMKVVFSGAGAAAIATARMFVSVGVRRENVWMLDLHGLVYVGRPVDMFPEKEAFAQPSPPMKLAEVLVGADVFMGLSVGGILTGDMLKGMRPQPIVFAMANPDPEITYEEAKAAVPDAIVATGRSDYPNQVNNVLGFPFVFRGALDCRARAINEEMKVAAAQAHGRGQAQAIRGRRVVQHGQRRFAQARAAGVDGQHVRAVGADARVHHHGRQPHGGGHGGERRRKGRGTGQRVGTAARHQQAAAVAVAPGLREARTRAAHHAVQRIGHVGAANRRVVQRGQRAPAALVAHQHQRDGQHQGHADGHGHKQFHQGEAALAASKARAACAARQPAGCAWAHIRTWVT